MAAALRDLPLKAAYSIGELSRGTGIERRTLKRILERAEVTFLDGGRVVYVPLSELEWKVRPLWEAVKAAQCLRGIDI